MDLLKPAVLTAENNGNYQRTQEQKKCRTQKQHAKNTMTKYLTQHLLLATDKRQTVIYQGRLLRKNKM